MSAVPRAQRQTGPIRFQPNGLYVIAVYKFPGTTRTMTAVGPHKKLAEKRLREKLKTRGVELP